MKRAARLSALSALVSSIFALIPSIGMVTASAAQQATARGTFPVTVNPSNGPVTIRSRPTRVMSLSASATQMIYAMGAGPQVVAVDKYSTYPHNAPRTGLTGFETGAESYAHYHPDLIVLAQTQGSLASELAALGIPTLVLPPANTIGDTYAQIRLLGQATGRVQQATAEIVSIRHKLGAIVRSVGTRAHGDTYYQEIDPTLYTATSHTFIGSLYSSLGMVNIADTIGASIGGDYPQISAEALLKANPDYVFLADTVCCGQSAKSFAERPGFSNLRAVRLHHVFLIPDPIASEWGPRIVTFLQTVANDVTATR